MSSPLIFYQSRVPLPNFHLVLQNQVKYLLFKMGLPYRQNQELVTSLFFLSSYLDPPLPSFPDSFAYVSVLYASSFLVGVGLYL